MHHMTLDTRSKLLNAAHSIVLAKGIVNLTLEEVARAAHVSKGGLLYHFPSKESLVQAMLDRALTSFEQQIARLRGEDRTPGSWLRAYIRASLQDLGRTENDLPTIGSALLASLGTNPALANPYMEHLRTWIQQATGDGLDPWMAQTIRLAVDGLWMHDSLGLTPYTEPERHRLIERLLSLASIHERTQVT